MAVQHRTHRELEWQPVNTSDGELPQEFRLDTVIHLQRRDGRSQIWLDEKPATRLTIADNISRRELSGLIASGTDWLAWDGKDD